MKYKAIALLLSAPLVLGSAALAGDPPAATAVKPAQTATKPAADPNRMVCQRIHSVGSLFVRKLCKTAREWEIEEELAQDIMKRAKRETTPSSN